MSIYRWFKFISISVAPLTFPLCVSLSHAADIYSWQDENGSTVYSNQPNPNAKQIKLKPISFVKTASPKKGLSPTQRKTATAHHIKFLYPLPDQSIQHPGESLTFIVQNASTLLAQNPEEEKQVVVLLDNHKTTSSPIYQNMFDINTPPPGKHSIQLRILDKDQSILAETSKVSFYVHSSELKKAAGTQIITKLTYQETAGGIKENNMDKFYKAHEDSLITPQEPYKVDWDAYKNQVSK